MNRFLRQATARPPNHYDRGLGIGLPCVLVQRGARPPFRSGDSTKVAGEPGSGWRTSFARRMHVHHPVDVRVDG